MHKVARSTQHFYIQTNVCHWREHPLEMAYRYLARVPVRLVVSLPWSQDSQMSRNALSKHK